MMYNRLLNECDLLQGNINRIMVSDDTNELFKMFAYAHKHLDTIFWENYHRVIEKERK